MLKKNILFLLLGACFVATPVFAMNDAKSHSEKPFRNQAIDDEPVTIELQDEQVKVEAKYAKLSGTLRNLIDDVGTDVALLIRNVTGAMWSNIVVLLPHVFSMTSQDVDSQEKKRLITIIAKTIQSYDGATLTGFIAAVNYLDIPLLLELAVQVAEKTGIQKITPEQIMTLPNEIRHRIIAVNLKGLLGLPKQICKGHTESIVSVCISADGNTIVSASKDGTVRIWNRNGTQRALCQGHTKSVVSVCISADGNTIVSGSKDGTVRIWNGNGSERAVCKCYTDWPGRSVCCISQDGNTIVSVSDDTTVCIWNKDGTQRAICNRHRDLVNSVCISQDGNTIVSGSDDTTVCIWNKDGTQRAICKGHTHVVNSVCISQDGNTIVSGSNDNTVRIWNSDGTQRAVYKHTDVVNSVCISADGQTIVSRSADRIVRILNVDGIQRVRSNNKKCVFGSMCISEDGKAVIGNSDGTMSMVNLSCKIYKDLINYHERSITALCVSPNGNTIVSGSEDRSVHILDTQLARRLKNINKEQTLDIWVFLQQELLPMLKTGIVKADTNNCWRRIIAIMEDHTTQTIHENTNVDGGEAVVKRHRSDE